MAADPGGGDRADGQSTILWLTWVATIATVAGTVPVVAGLFEPLDSLRDRALAVAVLAGVVLVALTVRGWRRKGTVTAAPLVQLAAWTALVAAVGVAAGAHAAEPEGEPEEVTAGAAGDTTTMPTTDDDRPTTTDTDTDDGAGTTGGASLTTLQSVAVQHSERLAAQLDGEDFSQAVVQTVQDANPLSGPPYNQAFVEYNLGNKYERLTGTAGIDDTSPGECETEMVVFGDSEVLLTQTVKLGDTFPVDVDVTGVLRLRLEANVVVGSCEPKEYGLDQDPRLAVWGDLRLT